MPLSLRVAIPFAAAASKRIHLLEAFPQVGGEGFKFIEFGHALGGRGKRNDQCFPVVFMRKILLNSRRTALDVIGNQR